MSCYQDSSGLLRNVIDGNYCVGCGACASVNNSPYEMMMSDNGTYLPVKCNTFVPKDMEAVCPFSDVAKNEDEISNELFGKEVETQRDKYIGHYLDLYAGYVTAESFRDKGSSGGVVSWLLCQMLNDKVVDYAIHVESNIGGRPLFKYSISSTVEEICKGAKSKYYPVEMSGVLKIVRENPGRYVFVGVPCFVKAIRLMSNADELIKERIPYTIGLVCGHLKSTFFSEALAWELGVQPDVLRKIDFRVKVPNEPASSYAVTATYLEDGKDVDKTSLTKHLFSSNWGYGFFKLNACDYCDDVLAETADISVGDAWLPEFESDFAGTSIVIVRNSYFRHLISSRLQQLWLVPLSPERIKASQAGGFRHRREGLAYRLHLKDSRGQQRPQKRVDARSRISRKRRQIYEKRIDLRELSFDLFKQAKETQSFDFFRTRMYIALQAYDELYKPSIAERLARKLKAILKRIIPSRVLTEIRRIR